MNKLVFSVRPASEEDLDAVVAIEKSSNSPPWTKAAFAAELAKEFSHFWVITDNETDSILYAYAVFSALPDFAHIQTIAVNPQHRNKKIGTYFLRQIINFLMKKEVEKVVLELRKSNLIALKLYQSVGFIIIHSVKNSYPDGEDAYSMVYQLNRAQPEKPFHSDLIEAEEEFELDDSLRSKKNLN